MKIKAFIGSLRFRLKSFRESAGNETGLIENGMNQFLTFIYRTRFQKGGPETNQMVPPFVPAQDVHPDGVIPLLANHYSLNGIKSKTVGDGQYGTARFASEQKSNGPLQVPYEPALWRQGKHLPKVQGIVVGGLFSEPE